MHLYVTMPMNKQLMFTRMRIGIWSVTKSCKHTNKGKQVSTLQQNLNTLYIQEAGANRPLKVNRLNEKCTA